MHEREQRPEEGPPMRRSPPTTRMPEDSVLYERVIPALLVVLGIVTVGLILFALGVLLGIVPFQ